MTPRAARAFPLAALALLAGCSQENQNGDAHANVAFACVESIDQLCANDGICSWTALLGRMEYCPSFGSIDQYYVGDCGDYLVLRHLEENGFEYRYYDAASGVLIAVLQSVAYNTGLETTCPAGPASGFTPPDCANTNFHVAPEWCAADGGTDGSDRPSDGP